MKRYLTMRAETYYKLSQTYDGVYFENSQTKCSSSLTIFEESSSQIQLFDWVLNGLLEELNILNTWQTLVGAHLKLNYIRHSHQI